MTEMNPEEREQLSALFGLLAELADAEGDVPDDGSGVDGVWQTTIEDPDTGDPWYIALNADPEEGREADLPDPHGSHEIPAGHAVIFYADAFAPAGMVSPWGGQFTVDGREPRQADEGALPRGTEDQVIHAVQERLDELDHEYDGVDLEGEY